MSERQCEFCGCRTNARLRACCENGRKADAEQTPAPPSRGDTVYACREHTQTNWNPLPWLGGPGPRPRKPCVLCGRLTSNACAVN